MLIDILHFGYGKHNIIGVCLVKVSKHNYILNGLYLYTIDMFNYIPISNYFIGDRETVQIESFNTDGVLLNFNDYSNQYISLERFSFCLYKNRIGDPYKIYIEKVINTHSLLSLLFSARYYLLMKHFNSNQNSNTPKVNEICRGLYNDLKELEDNYLIEYMEDI
jgi:hypothetical protein